MHAPRGQIDGGFFGVNKVIEVPLTEASGVVRPNERTTSMITRPILTVAGRKLEQAQYHASRSNL